MSWRAVAAPIAYRTSRSVPSETPPSGHAGPAEGAAATADAGAAFEAAYRNARPHRQVHRRLDLRTRCVIEDPIVRDSKSSHLVQAADLVAYAAGQWLWVNTDLWPKGGPRHGRPLVEIAEAYEGLAHLWLPGEEFGVKWAEAGVLEYEEALG